MERRRKTETDDHFIIYWPCYNCLATKISKEEESSFSCMLQALPQMAKYSLLWITLVIISAICCNSGGLAQNPEETFTQALRCFNDKYIYSSCNEAYRLTQSGNINVPAAATNQFCYGPCLAETHLVLDCIDHTLSNFVFYNKATLNDVRSTLQAACGHTDQRGNFNVGEYMQDYMQDEWSSADVPRQSNLFTFILAISVLFFIVREAL